MELESPTTPGSPKIGAVVSQAKETASALWVLLHARQCTDDNCRLLHCSNAKGIFSLSRAASTGVKLKDHQEAAVAEARKLLSHFKECRQSRLSTSYENGSGGGAVESADAPSAPPACLVCSLVARARPSSSPSVGTSICLDFTNSPYDPALPSPSLQLPLHGHGTRSGGRRRSSSSGSFDETSSPPTSSTSASLKTTKQQTSSNTSSSPTKTSAAGEPWKIPTSQRSRGKRERGLSHSDTPTLGPAEGDWGFGSLDMAQSLPPQAINMNNGSGSGGGVKSQVQGRNRSSSLSALPLTSEDQVGASVLSSFFTTNKSSKKGGAKRIRSVSWGNELGGRTDESALGTPNWMLNGRNSDSSSSSSSSGGDSITNLPSVGHIASFRRPLVSLSRPTSSSPTTGLPSSSSSLMGPRSPPSLAKLADAVDRSIHSPTSMLGYIEPHRQTINPNMNESEPQNNENVNTTSAASFMPPPPQPSSSSSTTPPTLHTSSSTIPIASTSTSTSTSTFSSSLSTTPPTTVSYLKVPQHSGEEEASYPYSPHKELSLMKLADVMLQASSPSSSSSSTDETQSNQNNSMVIDNIMGNTSYNNNQGTNIQVTTTTLTSTTSNIPMMEGGSMASSTAPSNAQSSEMDRSLFVDNRQTSSCR